jgi:hypothetical protein
LCSPSIVLYLFRPYPFSSHDTKGTSTVSPAAFGSSAKPSPVRAPLLPLFLFAHVLLSDYPLGTSCACEILAITRSVSCMTLLPQVIAPMSAEKAPAPTASSSAPVKIVVAAAKVADSSAAGTATPAVANAWAKGNLTSQLKVGLVHLFF